MRWFGRRALTPEQVDLVVRALLDAHGDDGVDTGEIAGALAWFERTEAGAAVLPLLKAGLASIGFDDDGDLFVKGTTPYLLKPVGEREF